MEIKIENLCKKYGNHVALDHICLRIETGMYGLLGANGAGKTTLIRILATILEKDSGEVNINHIPIENRKQIRSKIGYLPQKFDLYPNFSVYESMDYFMALTQVKNKKKENIDKLLEMVNLRDSYKVKVKALSGGMKQRLGIAISLINEPEILLVDEPTVGLDPEERLKFRNILAAYAAKKIVILSTHIIGDIEETCKSLAVIKKGKILFEGTTENFRKQSDHKVWEITMLKEKASQFMQEDTKQYHIISQMEQENNIKIRMLSEDKPSEEAIKVNSKLEDSYIWFMDKN